MDAGIVGLIRERLAACEAAENVRILWAIESGSRAWNFPSPDSDYDCRFVYLRRREDYLSLFPRRDVIEYPVDAVFDVNGWDLGKAIRLLLKGNAVIIEWLMSPHLYAGEHAFRDEFLGLAREIGDRDRIARHYLHLAYSMRDRVLGEGADVPLKKVFYLLRPCMALRWLRLRAGERVAPMDFRVLAGESDLAPALAAEIDRMLDLKARTREMGEGTAPPVVAAFALAEIAAAETAFPEPEGPVNPAHRERADAFFRAMLERFSR